MKRLRKIMVAGALATVILVPYGAFAASIVVDIPESYATVTAGNRLYFQLNLLYPENERRQDIRISYTVHEGNTVIASSQFLKAIETQASFTDYTVIPSNAKKGLHTIDIDIYDDTGTLIAKHVSASFQVAKKDNLLLIYFYVLLAAVMVVGIVMVIEVQRVLARIRIVTQP